ncbi:MAG: ABC transporter ATP-binding protein, partial [Clostridia bacterium]|nr:ABC transporter ATP-binding protein [Clostridia bacterium]
MRPERPGAVLPEYNKNRNKSNDKKALKWILNISRPQIPALLVIIAGDAVWALFGTLTALFSKEIINSATGGNRDRMIVFIVTYLVVSLALLGLHAVMRYLSEKCKAKLEILFRNRIFEKILKKSYPKISENHTGDLVTRMTGDVGVITDAATTIIPQLVMMTVRLAFAMGVLIFLQWQFAIVFTAGGLLMFTCSRLLKGKVQKYHKEMQQADGKTRSFWQEIFENLVVIKAFAAEDRSVDKSETLMKEHFKLRMRRSLIGSLSMLGTASVVRVGHIFAIGYGAFKLFAGTMDYGTLTALTQLVG